MVNKKAVAAIGIAATAATALVLAVKAQSGGEVVHAQDGSGKPIAGAHVILASAVAEQSSEGYTDAKGNWSSPSPAGTYLLTIDASGYEILQQEVTIEPGKTYPFTLQATPPPVGLAMAFVSFQAGRSMCVATWENGSSQAVDAVCYVTVKDSTGHVAALGRAAQTVAPGQQAAFNMPFQVSIPGSPVTLAPGTYDFTTFVKTPYGAPISDSHSETDTV